MNKVKYRDGLPGIKRTPQHGTRSRYVAGCRCDDCRAANTAAYHKRKAKAVAMVEGMEKPADGICPGFEDTPCPTQTRLRSDSRALCGRCIDALAYNGLVDARPVRRHLRKLSRDGVGYKSVADACDVSRSVMQKIKSGEKRQVRKETADAILEVSADAAADHALIPAGPTWKMLKDLMPEYLGEAGLAQALGYSCGRIQISRKRCLAVTEHRVRKLYRQTFGHDLVGGRKGTAAHDPR